MPQNGWQDASHRRRPTASNDRVLEWETPTKELGVGQSTDGTREALAREVALGGRLDNVASHLGRAVARARENGTRDGGGEGGPDWNEGKNPHGVLLGRKERGEPRAKGRGKAKGTAGDGSTIDRCGFYNQATRHGTNELRSSYRMKTPRNFRPRSLRVGSSR